MTIASLNDLAIAGRQTIYFVKGTYSNINSGWKQTWNLAGLPAASGSLSPGNTANGISPTNALAGYPKLPIAPCQILVTSVELTGINAGDVCIIDRLFHCGAYAFNAATTLTAQPSYASRVTGGDYTGLQIWYEQVTAATGVQTVVVTYTNQDGVTGRTCPTFAATNNNAVAGMALIGLQSGDSGVQAIESVTGTIASAGTFNISVGRRIWSGYLGSPNYNPQAQNYDILGWPEIYPDSALVLLNTNQSIVQHVVVELAHL